MKKYLETGKIVAVHGVSGEVRVQTWCDDQEFLCGFKTLYFDNGRESIELISARAHKNIVVMKINGVDSVEQAQALRNKVLYIDRKDAHLPEGSYFIQDLIGLAAVDDDSGEELGELADISFTGANDVYHIKTKEGKSLLVPAIPEVVREIDIRGGKIKIHVLDGLEAV
ncbi:MAG: ribosome maturation factor RimM [Oscillospiraceae bacterium]|nr:ribosome maturation factor RimM [Oscillospiraceae bacterium]